MSPNAPANWTNSVSKAAGTLLLAAIAAFVAWQLLRPLLPVLAVVVALVAIYRFAVGGSRRGGW